MQVTNHVFRISLSFFVLALASTHAANQDRVRLDEAKSLKMAGSFKSAEQVLQSAISAWQGSATKDLVELWNELGEVHQALARLNEASDDYQKALHLNESLSSPVAIDLAVSYNNLGTIEELRHQFPAAEVLFRRSLSILTETHLDSESMTGSVRTNLAMSLQRQEKYSEAESFYSLGLEQLKIQAGERSAEYGKALRNFGLFQYETGRYLKALEVQQRAYDIEASLPFVTDSDKAIAKTNLALTLGELGSYPEAERLLRAAIQLQKGSPTRDPNLAMTLDDLGVLEEKTGRLDEARAAETEALKMAQQTLSTGDPLLPTIWQNLGNTAAAQNEFGEAKGLYAKAAEGWLKAGGENSNYSATITSLGTLERRLRHHTRARELYAKALQIDETILGANHPRVASDLCNVAVELYSQRKFDEALQLFERAEQIQEKAFGAQSVAGSRTWREVGMADVALKNLPDAERAYRRAIENSRVQLKDTPELMTWLLEYAVVLRKNQKFGPSEQALVEACAIRVRNVIAANKQAQNPAGVTSFK